VGVAGPIGSAITHNINLEMKIKFVLGGGGGAARLRGSSFDPRLVLVGNPLSDHACPHSVYLPSDRGGGEGAHPPPSAREAHKIRVQADKAV